MKFYFCEYATWHFLHQTFEKHPIYKKISTWGRDIFNYLIIKSKSHIQGGCASLGHVYSVYVTEYNKVIITIIIIKV